MTAEEIVNTLAKFHPDEKEIVASIVQRIDRGRDVYGPWEIDKDHYRDYRKEAFEEMVDFAVYTMAHLVRMDNESNRRVTRVYVCHPWSNDPIGNAKEITFICKGIVGQGALPIAPQLYLPAFMDEATQREQAIAFCLELLADCELVLAFGTPTDGMSRELAFARSRGIPVRHLDAKEQLS